MIKAKVQLQAGIGVVCLLAACTHGRAKCPLIYIDLEGEVRGSVASDDRILVEVSPNPNTPDRPIQLEHGFFKAQLAFDTTRSGGRFHHNCSRRPSTITVVLVSSEEERDRATLNINDHFT